MVVAVAGLALVARLAAREVVATTRNRADLSRARWIAEGCAERARFAADELLRTAWNGAPGETTWAALGRLLPSSRSLQGCELRVEALGTRLDVNGATEDHLHRLFVAAGVDAARADSLAQALLDWRDADDDPRPYGSEAAAYARDGRPPPRNAALADAGEALRVRGFDRVPGLDTLLGTEPARISLGHAPAAVLRSLPGIGAEAASRLVEQRERGAQLPELVALAGRLSPAARADFLRHLGALSAATALEPEGWLLYARGREGAPPVTAVVELKLVRAGARASMIRKRTWVE